MPNYEKVSAGRSKLVTNCETGNDRKFQRAMREDLMQWRSPLFGFKLQKKSNELMTKIFFIWNVQLVKNHGCFFSPCLLKDFLSKIVFSYLPKIDDFETEEPWKIWKLICMASNHKSESGTNCWLTGPVKYLAALSNEGKPENIL